MTDRERSERAASAGPLREALERLCVAAEDKETHQHLDGPECVPAVSVHAIRAALAGVGVPQEADPSAAPALALTQEDAAFIEDALDNAIPDADFGEVARSEVIRSVVRALREQGYTIALAVAPAAPAALDAERLERALNAGMPRPFGWPPEQVAAIADEYDREPPYPGLTEQESDDLDD